MDRRKGFDLYHTEIVIIRKEVCPTSKFENIDQVTFNKTDNNGNGEVKN